MTINEQFMSIKSNIKLAITYNHSDSCPDVRGVKLNNLLREVE